MSTKANYIEKTLRRMKLDPLSKAKNWFVPCLWHKDSPDDGGSLAITKNGGLVKCFSGACGIRFATFDEFVLAAGGESTELAIATKDPFGMDEVRDAVDELEKLGSTEEITLPPGAIPWNNGDWRGIRNEVLFNMGSLYWYDDSRRCERIVWPAIIDGELTGWTSRNLIKSPKNGDKHKHSWSFDHKTSMLFLDKVVEEGHNYIMLVEGPVDGLALWNAKIPGIPLFGTSSWSEVKEAHVLSLGIDSVVVGADTDAAGRKFRKRIESFCLANGLETFHVEAPRVPGVDKVDFGDVEEHKPGYLRRLRRKFRELGLR